MPMNSDLRQLRMYLRAADRHLDALRDEEGFISHTLSEIKISLGRALEWTDEYTWEQDISEDEDEEVGLALTREEMDRSGI